MPGLLEEYNAVLITTRELKKRLEAREFDSINKDLVKIFKEVSRLQEIPLGPTDDRDAVAHVIREIIALDEEYTKLILEEQNRILAKFREIRDVRQQREIKSGTKSDTPAPRFIDKKT